jgi:dTDP-4-dehydrorhamnose 3,5-epimerase
MDIHNTSIEGIKIIRPQLYGDQRGYFVESYAVERYSEVLGKEVSFVQDNISRSMSGVLRGLHFQRDPHAQGKLVSVLSGRVFDVAVDLRTQSKTFGQHVSIELTPPHQKPDGSWFWEQFWIPPGFAHGFLTLEDDTLFAYKCTHAYVPEADGGLLWNDPELGIKWPTTEGMKITVSDKDQEQPLLRNLP